MKLLATLIVHFLLGDSTCTDSLIGPSDQMVHARVVRLAWEDSVWSRSGQRGSITFFFTANDTYAVRAWTTTPVGKSCELVRTLRALVTTDVPSQPKPWHRRPGLKTFDLQGRRVEPTRSGRYFGRDTTVLK